jgi:hypothetical protein
LDSYSKVRNHGWQASVDSIATTYDGSGGSTDFSRNTRNQQTFTDQASGWFNPSWRQEVRNGQNATTPFDGVAYSEEPKNFFTAVYDVTWLDPSSKQKGGTKAEAFGTWYPASPPSGTPSSSVVTSVENRCIAQFLNNAESVQSSIEAGQDIGEYKETLHSIHKPLATLQDSLVNYLSQLRKLKKSSRNPAKLRKLLADTYLEFHFGWQPLVDDIAHLIADCGQYRFPEYPVKGSAHNVYQADTNTYQIGFPFFPDSLRANSTTTCTYSCRIKGAIRARNYDNGRSSLVSSLQLTPDRWIPTAWDLLPYSWIADYFVNIGDILQGLSFVSSSLIWGCKTTRNRCVTKVSDFRYTPDYPELPSTFQFLSKTSSVHGGNYECWSKGVSRRSVQGVDLIPSIEFRLPGTKFPFLNMGALLLQRSSGIAPFYHSK